MSKRVTDNAEDLMKNIGRRIKAQKNRESDQKNSGQNVRGQNNGDIKHQLEKKINENVKLKSNSTKIDNDIFEYLLPNLTTKQQSIYLRLYYEAIYKNKLIIQLSNSQLQELCNLSHQSIRDGLNELIDIGLLKKIKDATNNKAPIYEIIPPQKYLNIESDTEYSVQNI